MNITSYRSVWYSISVAAVVASIAACVIFGFNPGLDFSGGTRWQVVFGSEEAVSSDVPVAETLEEATAKSDSSDSKKTLIVSDVSQKEVETFFASQTDILTRDAIVQPTGDGYLITLEDLDDTKTQALQAGLAERVGDFEVVSYRKVDASIGQSFKRKALIAIAVALVGIILFVAFTFRHIPKSINPWRFGSVAIIALFHDIMIVLGIFVVMGYFLDVELDLSFLTALLATLGFSVNDTIVILDRVRENIRLQKPHETFEDTIEQSIQQTLLRSINTSVSTLLPLVALLFFGASSIFYFVLALTLGIAIGTYSSIFLAAPMLVTWKNLHEKFE